MPRLLTLTPRVKSDSLARVAVLTTGPQRPRPRELAVIKRKIAKRSQGKCECTPCRRSGRPLPAVEFDHIVPLWEGGTNDFANWQHLSRECHKAKSAAEHRRRLGISP